ncbi:MULTISPECIES: DNA polymerase III subunit delta' [Oceanobacillus]|uniref:DNA polymerase III subunit delta n=1 Tax=Oceanobacillus kimchii TaxID=746691 RepID=A0ABQ5TCG8_9BACI|nr:MULTISPECIES: DNA polymerase III subunit delta' [Oceanobacillus]MBT2599860.1 DNA polymerase III subunit delta' [Oceanobacillus sp. ISL-74]MBT2652690.1 DNA polymerase III subunit delta' [Oceanobacillus sp. ISL-73]MCT1577233.1 DNA polymerase III subunit delta' [Oceanobacillus kimchii]MCT2135303.1 DNA polymerase III subunit delta' [Oceanobacillus kimchii]OEH56568.1 DNA polymerase III subunit delta' [Oceanobacillus sp. E9]
MVTWEEITDLQPIASRTIINSINKGRVSHAYLLQGERGTGKRDIALLLAKYLFCLHREGANPCHTCNNCKRIDSGNHPDVHWIEPDGQSIKIEQVRNLQKEFTYSGMESNQKVYVIQDADTLTINAANRLLKFLEEPSKQTTAIMMTENGHSILPTIRSRCQIIELQPLPPDVLNQRLQAEGVQQFEANLLSALTNNTKEALSLHQDEWFAGARKIVVQLIEMYVQKPEDVYLFIHQQWIPHFKERTEQQMGLDLLLLGFQDILHQHIKEVSTTVLLPQDDAKMERAMMSFSKEQLLFTLQLILTAKRKLKQNVQPTLVMEQLALQIQR